jgi:hypothetical protein
MEAQKQTVDALLSRGKVAGRGRSLDGRGDGGVGVGSCLLSSCSRSVSLKRGGSRPAAELADILARQKPCWSWGAACDSPLPPPTCEKCHLHQAARPLRPFGAHEVRTGFSSSYHGGRGARKTVRRTRLSRQRRSRGPARFLTASGALIAISPDRLTALYIIGDRFGAPMVSQKSATRSSTPHGACGGAPVGRVTPEAIAERAGVTLSGLTGSLRRPSAILADFVRRIDERVLSAWTRTWREEARRERLFDVCVQQADRGAWPYKQAIRHLGEAPSGSAAHWSLNGS